MRRTLLTLTAGFALGLLAAPVVRFARWASAVLLEAARLVRQSEWVDEIFADHSRDHSL